MVRRIKLFEKFIGEGEELQELDEIFTSLDLDYDVEVLVFLRNDIKDSNVYTVSLTFESKISLKELLQEIWNRISMARNLGYKTYEKIYKFFTRVYPIPHREGFYGQIEYVHTHLGTDYKHKIKINDKIFTTEKIVDDISGLYAKKIHRNLDPYQRFDLNYQIFNVLIHFERD